MSLSKLHKNGILTGVIDYLCLLCEEPFRCLNKLHDHLKDPSHLDNQEKFGYSKTDLVRKVKTGYFCEACNARIQSLAKVTIHASDEEHLVNKELVDEETELDELSTLLKYEGNDVVFGSVLVNENAWNSIVEGSCLVCDCEDEDHISTLNHISKLIQCKLQVFNKNYLYRLIDKNSFQCLTCNFLYPSDKFLSHFETPAHKLAYAKCKNSNVSKVKAVVSKAEIAKKEDKSHAKSETKVKNEENTQKEIENCKTGPTLKPGQKNESDSNLKDNNFNEKVKTDSKKEDSSAILKGLNSKVSVPDTRPSKKKGSIKKDAATKETANTDKIPYPSNFDNYESQVEVDCRKLGMKDCISFFIYDEPFCMLCNIVTSDVRSHLATKNHIMLLRMERKITFKKNHLNSQIDKNQVTKEASETPLAATQDESEQPNIINKKAIAKSFFEYQQNAIVIDLITETANCKKCNMDIEFDPKSIEEHIKTHKSIPTKAKNTQSKEKKSDKFELQSYCKENNIHYSPADNHLLCRVCNSKVPKSENNIKDHVNGAKHKASVIKSQNTIPVKPYESVPQKRFLNKVFIINRIYETLSMVNFEFCVAFDSFHLLIEVNDRLRCQVCEVFVARDILKVHLDGNKHGEAFNRIPVLVSIENEFIREVRPNIFHCAFCNTVDSEYGTLRLHLTTAAHALRRRACEEDLRCHLPSVMYHHAGDQFAERMHAALALRALADC